MPDISQDRQALDWLVANPSDPLAPDVMRKLGIEEQDLQAWDYAAKNSNNPVAVKVKNKVFEKVAAANPALQTQGVSALDRFAIKNLISENTDLQQNYLRKKGYETRVVGDAVEVRRPGEERFKVIDPQGFDVWDVTDLAGDAIEAIAGGFATGAKALGLIGAVPTGGAALLASSALGGAATGAVETARQGIGVATGLREEMDPGRIFQATATGAIVPGITKAAGGILKGAGQGVQKLARVSPKPEAEAIRQAAEEIGAKATPGQLTDSALVQKLESSLYQSRGKLGGIGLRSQIDDNIKAAQGTAEEIVKNASGKTAYEVGQDVEQKLTSELTNKLKPAEAIYQKYEQIFKASRVRPDITDISDKIKFLKSDTQDTGIKSLLSKYEKMMKPTAKVEKGQPVIFGPSGNIVSKPKTGIKNLDDLKKFRTEINGDIKKASRAGDDNAVRVLNDLKNTVTETRSKNLSQLGQDAATEISQADSIYRNAITEVEDSILRAGQKAKGSPKGELKRFMEKTPEIDRINKILKTNDPKKIESVKQAFPEAFESLRQGKIQDIAARAETAGVVNPKKLANLIGKLPPESARLIFGDDAFTKAKALKTFLDSVPPMVGPSGTPSGLEIFKMMNLMSQASSVGRSVFLNSLKRLGEGKDILTKTGKALTKEVSGFNIPASAGILGSTTLMPPPRDNRGLQLPRE